MDDGGDQDRLEERVRRAALALPGTSERTSYGTPAFYVARKPFARIHDMPGILLLWRPSVEDREELIAAEPRKFTTTPHYSGHASVLMRIAEVDDAELGELLAESWSSRAPARMRGLLDQSPQSDRNGPGDQSG